MNKTLRRAMSLVGVAKVFPSLIREIRKEDERLRKLANQAPPSMPLAEWIETHGDTGVQEYQRESLRMLTDPKVERLVFKPRDVGRKRLRMVVIDTTPDEGDDD